MSRSFVDLLLSGMNNDAIINNKIWWIYFQNSLGSNPKELYGLLCIEPENLHKTGEKTYKFINKYKTW